MGSGQNQLQLRVLTHLLIKSKRASDNEFIAAEGIFCNLEKASDYINHGILLYELELY
jgi:hypothetical protein